VSAVAGCASGAIGARASCSYCASFLVFIVVLIVEVGDWHFKSSRGYLAVEPTKLRDRAEATSQSATKALARSPSTDTHGNSLIARAIGRISSQTLDSRSLASSTPKRWRVSLNAAAVSVVSRGAD
jgi:hypothetical protein